MRVVGLTRWSLAAAHHNKRRPASAASQPRPKSAVSYNSSLGRGPTIARRSQFAHELAGLNESIQFRSREIKLLFK